MVDRKHRIDPKDTEAANTHDGNEHGDERFSEAAKLTAENLHDTAEEIGGTKNEQSLITVSNRQLVTGNIDRE